MSFFSSPAQGSSLNDLRSLSESLPEPTSMGTGAEISLNDDMESVLTSLLDSTPEFAAAANIVLDNEAYLMDDDRAHFAKRFREITGISLTNGVAEFVGSAAAQDDASSKSVPTYLSIKTKMCGEFGISSWDNNKHLVTKALENNHADVSFISRDARSSASFSDERSSFLDSHARFAERFEDITGQSLNDSVPRRAGKTPPTCKCDDMQVKKILKKEFGDVIWESKKVQVHKVLERVLMDDRRDSSLNSLEILKQIVGGRESSSSNVSSRSTSAAATPLPDSTAELMPQTLPSSAMSMSPATRLMPPPAPVPLTAVALPPPMTTQISNPQDQQGSQLVGSFGQLSGAPATAASVAHAQEHLYRMQALHHQQLLVMQQQAMQAHATTEAQAGEDTARLPATPAAPSAVDKDGTTAAANKRPLTEKRRTKKNARERERRQEERTLYSKLIHELSLPPESKTDKALILNAAVREIEKLATELIERKAKRQRLDDIASSSPALVRGGAADMGEIVATAGAAARDHLTDKGMAEAPMHSSEAAQQLADAKARIAELERQLGGR